MFERLPHLDVARLKAELVRVEFALFCISEKVFL